MNRNAYLVERFSAYIIDIILISFVSGLLSFPFTSSKNYEKLSKEANTIAENYQKGKIDAITYLNQYMDINYDLSRETGASSILSIIVYVLYFIVFQYYNNGQTLGKRVMKIKMKSKDKDTLDMNNLVLRELFNNSILSSILISVFLLIGKDVYGVGSTITSCVQFIYIMICALMISFRKDSRSLSDLIGKTKVISLRSEEE